jgi:hypothetical protein
MPSFVPHRDEHTDRRMVILQHASPLPAVPSGQYNERGAARR